jgi:hypothetical protein
LKKIKKEAEARGFGGGLAESLKVKYWQEDTDLLTGSDLPCLSLALVTDRSVITDANYKVQAGYTQGLFLSKSTGVWK